jgi:hypothetical protein
VWSGSHSWHKTKSLQHLTILGGKGNLRKGFTVTRITDCTTLPGPASAVVSGRLAQAPCHSC